MQSYFLLAPFYFLFALALLKFICIVSNFCTSVTCNCTCFVFGRSQSQTPLHHMFRLHSCNFLASWGSRLWANSSVSGYPPSQSKYTFSVTSSSFPRLIWSGPTKVSAVHLAAGVVLTLQSCLWSSVGFGSSVCLFLFKLLRDVRLKIYWQPCFMLSLVSYYGCVLRGLEHSCKIQSHRALVDNILSCYDFFLDWGFLKFHSGFLQTGYPCVFCLFGNQFGNVINGLDDTFVSLVHYKFTCAKFHIWQNVLSEIRSCLQT